MTQSNISHSRSDRPNLEQKKKLAKELLKATRSLNRRQAARFTWNTSRFRGKSPDDVIREGVSLADAQHVVARESGFESWPELTRYIKQLESDPNGKISLFEDAVRMIIRGQATEFRELLVKHPQVATMRSLRQHGSFLPHYLAANGVEDEHQITPPNAPEMARILFENGGSEIIDELAAGGLGSTALVALVTSAHPHLAGVQGELVDAFCEAGAKPNGPNDEGEPLALAIGFRYTEAARALAKRGARIDNLPAAAALGQVDRVKEFLDPSAKVESKSCMFPNPNHPPLDSSVAPHPAATVQFAFVLACMFNEAEIAKLMLENGASVNEVSRGKITAIHEACYQGHQEIVRFLLDEGADPKLRDGYWNSTAIGWSGAGGHKELVDELFELGDFDFFDALEKDRLDLAAEMLQKDPEMANSINESGAALRYAVVQGKLELVELLIQYGADLMQKDQSGLSLLECASKAGHPQIEAVLKAHLGPAD